MSLETEGTADITKKILKFARKLDAANELAVKAGAKLQYEDIKNSIPEHLGTAKREVMMGKPKKENGEITIDIGWTKNSKSGWRIRFFEWGTVHQRPQRVIEKSIKRTKSDKEREMIRVLKKEYKL